MDIKDKCQSACVMGREKVKECTILCTSEPSTEVLLKKAFFSNEMGRNISGKERANTIEL